MSLSVQVDALSGSFLLLACIDINSKSIPSCPDLFESLDPSACVL